MYSEKMKMVVKHRKLDKMPTPKKRGSWKIRQANNNCQNKTCLKYLGDENTWQNKMITANENIDKLQDDWSGYFDELDPY